MSLHFDPALWTIAFALNLGLISYLLSRKFYLSPVIFFLFFGILFGEEYLNWLQPSKLGSNFKTIISIGIAIILFEAGLTLDYSILKNNSKVIWKLLSIGVLTTWLVNALAIYYIFSLPFSFSLFSSSLIIVTGPTVIVPILKRLQVNKKLFNILHWEGVLIDPIGVFIATLSLEILLYTTPIDSTVIGSTMSVVVNLLLRIFFGTFFGVFFGFLAFKCLQKKWIPSKLLNIFVLMMAVFTFAICDFFVSESGLLATVIAGLITGYKKNAETEEVKKFKIEITHLIIALLFILISSSLDIDKIIRFGWKGVILIVLIILITRPINIFLCTINSNLNLREKLFISWISPRGIIAASMATLFTLYLSNESQYQEVLWFAEALVFSVILSTVFIQGLSAGLLSRVLKVNQNENKEWLIVGAHEFSEVLYRYLVSKNNDITIIDNNRNRVMWFKKKGVNIINFDSLSSKIYSNQIFFNITSIISLTDNEDLNALICQHWKNMVERENLYRWEKKSIKKNETLEGEVIWSNLPKPSIISSEIVEKKIHIIEKKLSEKKDRDVLLLYYHDNKVEMKIDEITLQENPDIKGLFLCRDNFKLSHFYNPKLTLIDDQSNNSILLYENFVTKLSFLSEVDQQNLASQILHKYEEGSLSIGKNVGIMHLQLAKINQPILGIIITKNGIDINSYDYLPCRVMFVLISPSGDPHKNIWIVSTISQLIIKTDIKEKLLMVNNLNDISKIIEEI